MVNLIGNTLDRYHITERLGEGGMATVYKAYDTRLEREVAIKVILPAKQDTDVFLKRFEREAKALAQLGHPNIVGVMDYGHQNNLPYLVMEFIAGGTLKSRLGNGPMNWREVVSLLIPIARALAFAHEKKIIHRDVKPSNILVTLSGEPMLSDFGIAKLLEAEETTELTATGAGIGTPEYMSPEQAMGRADERSDIYALGVILYEMLTGRRPYEADTPMAVLIKKNTEPLPHPKKYVNGLPKSVEHVLIKTLARDPANRYQRMADLAHDLQLISDSAGTPDFWIPNQKVDWQMTTATAVAHPEKRAFPFWLLPVGGVLLLCAVGFVGIMAARFLPSFPFSSGSGPTREPTSLPAEPSPPAPSRVEIPADVTLMPTPTTTVSSTQPPTSVGNALQQAKWIAFQSAQVGSSDLYLIDTNGNNLQRVTTGGAHERYPSWSPDGRQIVFQTNEGQDWELAILDIDTKRVTMLTNNGCDDFGPSWSPKGGWIVFYSNCDGDENSRDIYKIRSNGSERTRLTFSTGNYNWFPSWSPDGQKITFSSNRPGKYYIFVMDKDGNNPQQLARGCNSYFSPDGSKILFGVYCDDTDALWLMNADGSDPRPITSGHECRNATWATDGRHIIFQESPNGKAGPFALYIMDLNNPDDDNWVKLVDYSQNAVSPVWQP